MKLVTIGNQTSTQIPQHKRKINNQHCTEQSKIICDMSDCGEYRRKEFETQGLLWNGKPLIINDNKSIHVSIYCIQLLNK